MIKGILINGELEYCYDFNEFKNNKLIKNISNNEFKYKVIVLTLALLLINQHSILAVDKFGVLENKIFDAGRKIARIACLAGFFKDSIKSIFKEDDLRGGGKALIKYGTYYGSVYLILWVFDLIEESLI